MATSSFQNIRVVLIDEQDVARLGVRTALTNNPQIDVVADGSGEAEALSLFCTYKPDVMIYGVNQIEPCQVTGEMFSDCKTIRHLTENYRANIVLLSRHCHSWLVQAAVCAGVRGFVHKDEVMTSSASLTQAIFKAVGRPHHFFLGKTLNQRLLSPGTEAFKEIPSLTERRIEMMQAVVDNPHLTVTQIATRLGVAESTLRNNLSQVAQALDTPHLNGSMIECLRLGLVQINN